MAIPGKLYRDGLTLRMENFSGTPHIFLIEEFELIHHFNDEIFSWIDEIIGGGANGMRTLGIYAFDKGQEEEPFAKRPDGSYDLNSFNEPFFQYMTRWISYADDRGVFVLYDLFDTCSFWAQGYAQFNPFYQIVGSDYFAFSDLNNTNLVNIQKRYIQKVVDTMKPHLNVIYGISNEFQGNKDWYYEMSRYVKSLAPDNLVAGSANGCPAIDDPSADMWFIHTGSYDFSTRTSHIREDIDEMSQSTGGNPKIFGFSNDGFGNNVDPENPHDMRVVAQDAVNNRLQVHAFMDHKAWIPTLGKLGPLNIATYQAIADVFQPTPKAKEGPQYKLDEKSFESLRKKGVPDNIVSQLEQLKDKEYMTEKDFVSAVEATIGKPQTDQYKTLIVQYATIGRLPDGFLDIFNVASLPSTHPGAHVDRGGKAIGATTVQGFLCFGQYKKGYPTIPLQALFSILIDNNTADDRNILIVDVYDHHSDRVLGKRVITRKDFKDANKFCLFTFNFTPPSDKANMEFRIYYIGYSYVLANRIAVIDPAAITTTDEDELLQMMATYKEKKGGGSISPQGFCKGGEIFCMPTFTPELVTQNQGTLHGGAFRDGMFTPASMGGLQFPVTVDTNRKYMIEFEIEGNIPRPHKGTLFRLEAPDISYYVCLERLDDGTFTGMFRLTLGDIDYHNPSFLITSPTLSGAYSTVGWGNEPHRFQVIMNQSEFQLVIDEHFVSRVERWGKAVPGQKQMDLMIGNHVQKHIANEPAITKFKQFKIVYL